MIVLVNLGSSIDATDTAVGGVEAFVRARLAHFADRITRVEVHITDENSDRKAGANDKKCVLEARVSRRKPVAVSDHAATVGRAVDGAAAKLAHLLDKTLGRVKSRV